MCSPQCSLHDLAPIHLKTKIGHSIIIPGRSKNLKKIGDPIAFSSTLLIPTDTNTIANTNPIPE